MPYIKQEDRDIKRPLNSGQLNFIITKILIQYMNDLGLSYSTINDIIGALECAKAEFQRRVVAPYEELKISHNGDVYE